MVITKYQIISQIYLCLKFKNNKQQQQQFTTSQLILNPLAPQVTVLIEAGQDNHFIPHLYIIYIKNEPHHYFFYFLLDNDVKMTFSSVDIHFNMYTTKFLLITPVFMLHA